MKEEPTFDGDEVTAVNMAAEESGAAVDPAETEDMVEPEEVARVRYVGSSNQRILTRADLSGVASADLVELGWSHGSEVPWAWWVELAGSEERARDVLRMQAHEFQLFGMELPEPEAKEEFTIGGAVNE
jgi:hypothetical protein